MAILRALLILLAAPVAAEAPMTGAQFDAYVTGKTVSFGSVANPDFGVEQYLPGNRVIWSAQPGDCIEGMWYEEDTNICFVYENDPIPKCWQVFDTGQGIRAEFAGPTGGTVLFEARETQPLICGDLFS